MEHKILCSNFAIWVSTSLSFLGDERTTIPSGDMMVPFEGKLSFYKDVLFLIPLNN